MNLRLKEMCERYGNALTSARFERFMGDRFLPAVAVGLLVTIVVQAIKLAGR